MTKNQARWQAPSNIAIVKYWGKHGRQLPMNPSVSFTLSEATTTTDIQWNTGTGKVEFLYDSKPKVEFAPRVRQYVNNMKEHLPELEKLDLLINSVNSFPHSSGIASSASFMASLALGLYNVTNQDLSQETLIQHVDKISQLARLGSGSACRSLFPGVAVWGKTEKVQGSSDEYAIDISKSCAAVFKDYNNDILIVSSEKKSVSSSLGHDLMNNHEYKEIRKAQALTNIEMATRALETGDEWTLGEILEKEALTLHGLMMSSSPGYILIKDGTTEIINCIREFRKKYKIPVFFSLDAGPNIHLLYSNKYEKEVKELIKDKLINYCEKIIEDRVGMGPIKLI